MRRAVMWGSRGSGEGQTATETTTARFTVLLPARYAKLDVADVTRTSFFRCDSASFWSSTRNTPVFFAVRPRERF